MIDKKNGKELSFIIHDRLLTTDADDTIRKDIKRGAIELITNSDDSYKRLENLNIPNKGLIEIEYERKKDSAIIKFRDFAEGMAEEELKRKVQTYADSTSGFNNKQKGRSVRGLWGRGLIQSLLGLGQGSVHTVKDGKYNRIDIYHKKGGPKLFKHDQKPANKKIRAELGIIKKNGTLVVADCYKIKTVTQYELLREQLQTHFEIRSIISDKNRNINFKAVRGKKVLHDRVLEFNYPKATKVFDEQIVVKNYPNVKITLELNKCDDELTTISEEKESALSGIIFYTQGLAVDNAAFDYAADEAFSYFYGSCDCPYIRELALKGEAVFSTNRTGPNWNDEFMTSLKETVLEKIKPFIEAKRKEIQNKRQSQLDKKQKIKMDESVNKLNELFRELLGENNLGLKKSTGKNKPNPNNGFGFLSDYFSIISNKTNSISLYANKSIATEGDIVNFSSEDNELNVITKDVSFHDTEWEDLVIATARVEGGQVGSNHVLIANFDNNEAQTLLHSVAKISRTEDPKPRTKNKGGFINDIKFDETPGVKQRVMFDASNNVVIFTKSPSVSLYMNVNGAGLDTPAGQTMQAELVLEAVSKAVAKRAIEEGKYTPLITGPDAINKYANELQNKYAEIIHKLFVEDKHMPFGERKIIDLKSRKEKEQSRVSEI